MSSSKSEELSQAIADILRAGGEKNEKSKSRKKEMRGVEVLLKSMNNLTTEEKLKVSNFYDGLLIYISIMKISYKSGRY